MIKKTFTYTLDKSSKKFICPSCDKKSFVRYKDSKGHYHEDVNFGRCDREVNCAYLNVPNDGNTETGEVKEFEPKKILLPSFIPFKFIEQTWTDYKFNPFTLWLVEKFGDAETVELIKRYRWGVDNTSIYTRTYTIFWQLDYNGNARSGKMIKYGNDGRRDKDSVTTWFHKKTDGGKPLFNDFNLQQCFFGEHLLSLDLRKPIAIVESEKTAIIASKFIDKYIWIACGGLTQIGRGKSEILKNRSVTLFPDLGSIGNNGDKYIDTETNDVWYKSKGVWLITDDKRKEWDNGSDNRLFRTGNGKPRSAFQVWSKIAKDNNWNISKNLENIATAKDRELGLDLADFLLR